jgi:hypothetical protein
VIAHIGGLPLEELVACVSGASAGLLVARARTVLRPRNRGRPRA